MPIMIPQQSRGYCIQCAETTLFSRTLKKPNHLVHALVTLFLCGIWIPIWIIAALRSETPPFRCQTCGSPFRKTRVTKKPV